MKALVVDDNEVSLLLLEATLRGAGFDVGVARDGFEALSLVRRDGYRLVVTDCEMPGMDGPEFCRAVRADDLAGYIYIMLVTSHDSPNETVEGLAAGADDFVGKPFNPHELIARARVGERVLAIETRDVAIFALARLTESRDPETGGHLDRVRGYCRLLARDLADRTSFVREIDNEFVRLVYATSPLHDIGKVGIPDSVLLKPGRLSEAEFEIMKQHTVIGARTLDAALESFPGVTFLQMARDLAASHHERFDGSGYPCGLAGDAIPLSARIMAVADVYDALTSRRVYKDAFPHEESRAEIVRGAASHFDPRVVDAFVRNEQEFKSIRLHYDDNPLARAV